MEGECCLLIGALIKRRSRLGIFWTLQISRWFQSLCCRWHWSRSGDSAIFVRKLQIGIGFFVKTWTLIRRSIPVKLWAQFEASPEQSSDTWSLMARTAFVLICIRNLNAVCILNTSCPLRGAYSKSDYKSDCTLTGPYLHGCWRLSNGLLELINRRLVRCGERCSVPISTKANRTPIKFNLIQLN